ncbi:MAG: methyl-accepting chemotaxis protein [Armatimonadetes bacterium]|nr:methyl-accepting chemotaxis protein [Armatimonadota bacterium]
MSQNRRIQVSLLFKLIPLVCILVGLASFVLIGLAGKTQKDTLKKRFETRHKALVSAIGTSSVNSVHSNNTQQLNFICMATKNDEDVQETMLLSPSLVTLGHNDDTQVGKDLSGDPWLQEALRSEAGLYRSKLSEKGVPVAEATARILDKSAKVIGLAYVRMSLENTYKELGEIHSAFVTTPHSLSDVVFFEQGRLVWFKGVGFTWRILFGSFLLSLLFLLMMLLPIKRLARVMKSMAEGDLRSRVRIKTWDETERLGLATNQMVIGVEGLVREVQGLSDSIVTGVSMMNESSLRCNESTKTMSDSVSSVVEGAEQQLGKVQEAETIIAEISEIVKLGAENVQNNFITTQHTAVTVTNGQVVFESLLDAVARIQEAVNQVLQILKGLEEQCQGLLVAEETIRKLTAETENLAGRTSREISSLSKPRGAFSVLGTRMEELADHSRKKAGQIKEALSSFRSVMLDTLAALEEVQREALSCLDLCGDTGKALEEIYTTVNQGKREITEIQRICEALHADNKSLIEEVQGIRDFSKQNAAFAEDVARVTQGQMMLIQHIAEGAASLSLQGEELVKQVRQFKVN